MKFFRPPNFFNLFEQFQKLVAFLLPIFGNVDGSWRVTSKLRGSTLIQVARRRSKVFQRFSASLVRVGDVQGVSRRHAVRGKKVHTLYFWCRKKCEKFIELCALTHQARQTRQCSSTASTRFFTIFDKLEMLVLSTAGGTQHRSHINNTFLLVIYVFSML